MWLDISFSFFFLSTAREFARNYLSVYPIYYRSKSKVNRFSLSPFVSKNLVHAHNTRIRIFAHANAQQNIKKRKKRNVNVEFYDLNVRKLQLIASRFPDQTNQKRENLKLVKFCFKGGKSILGNSRDIWQTMAGWRRCRGFPGSNRQND